MVNFVNSVPFLSSYDDFILILKLSTPNTTGHSSGTQVYFKSEDGCIQNCHLGGYIIGYTVAN